MIQSEDTKDYLERTKPAGVWKYVLFGLFLFSSYFAVHKNRENGEILRENTKLKQYNFLCDSVNKQNRRIMDSIITSNKEYSNSFNRLLDAHRKSHANNEK